MRRLAVASLFLVSGVFGALPSVANAACAEWDLSGDWGAVQSNGYQPRFVLRRTAAGYRGEAAYVISGGVTSYFLIGQKGNPSKLVRGTAEGHVRGTSIEITARWDNGSVGIYTATVNDFGRMQGVTFDQRNPKSTTTWVGDRNLKCVAAPPTPKNDGDRCPSGLVWRNVTEQDHVCVTPAVRAQVRTDNKLAAQRRISQPARGATCPSFGTCLRYDIRCKPGFVWRAAVPDDYVCVTQATHDQAKRDNLADAQRKLRIMETVK